jgi:hypothetical protein
VGVYVESLREIALGELGSLYSRDKQADGIKKLYLQLFFAPALIFFLVSVIFHFVLVPKVMHRGVRKGSPPPEDERRGCNCC